MNKALDPATLEELRALVTPEDPKFVANLMTLFLESVEKNMREIDLALGRHDYQGIRERAHALKSSCLNVGARGLASVCQALESLSSPESAGETEKWVVSLREQVAGAVREVKKLPEFLDSGL